MPALLPLLPSHRSYRWPVRGYPASPADPADLRPTLWDMDVVHAVQMVCPGQVGHLATTLLNAFCTDLGWDELAARLVLLLCLQ